MRQVMCLHRPTLRPDWLLLLFAGAVLFASGCGSRDRSDRPGAARRPGQGTTTPPSTGSKTKIRVEDGSGKLLFALDPSAKGFHVEREDGQPIGSVKVEADRVKVADAQDRPAFKVKRKADGFKLYRE